MALTETEIFNMVLDTAKIKNASVQEVSIKAAIASAVAQIMRAGEFPDEIFEPPDISVVAGTFRYALHDDVQVVKQVRLTDSGLTTDITDTYQNIELMDKLRYDGSTQTNAKPTQWSIRGHELYLYPTPDKTYTITIVAERLSSDIMSVPPNFRDAVMWGARSMFDPMYIGVFEKAKKEVQMFYHKQRKERKEFQDSDAVESHKIWQAGVNVF